MLHYKTFRIENFHFDIYVPLPTTNNNCIHKISITGTFTIIALEKELQKTVNDAYNIQHTNCKND
jgi:hypothetical protein